MGHAELSGGMPLECGNRLAKDKLLRIKDMADRVQELLMKRLVLAFEVEHGNRLPGKGWSDWQGGRLFHPSMVPIWMRESPIWKKGPAFGWGLGRRPKLGVMARKGILAGRALVRVSTQNIEASRGSSWVHGGGAGARADFWLPNRRTVTLRLKRLAKHYIVVTLRELTAPGLPSRTRCFLAVRAVELNPNKQKRE